MNRLSPEVQAKIVALLVENMGIRSVSRFLDIERNTVLRNALWIGEGCQAFHDRMVTDLKSVYYVEADELHSLVYGHDNKLPEHLQNNADYGDMYTWLAVAPHSRLVINWHMGKRGFTDAHAFIEDLGRRIPGRIHIVTDQLVHYRSAIEDVFGPRADYATVRKKVETVLSADGKFERGPLMGNKKASVMGNPEPEHVSTTHIESLNLSLRQMASRYNRATTRFSKNPKYKRAALALNFTYFNFCRRFSRTRVTPAMEVGLTDHIWEIEELLEAAVPHRKTRWTGHVAAIRSSDPESGVTGGVKYSHGGRG